MWAWFTTLRDITYRKRKLAVIESTALLCFIGRVIKLINVR